MTANFTAGAVLTASNLNAAINTDTINAQTGAGYTLVLSDAGKTVTLSNASAQTLTIPTNATVAFATGTVIEVLNIGAGTWTVGGAGVTINGTTSIPNKGGVRLLKTGTDTWWAGSPPAPNSATAEVLTSQTTTSTSYTDLATAGPAVTVTTGTKALIIIGSNVTNNTTATSTYVSVAVSGATTVAASDTYSLLLYWSGNQSAIKASRVYMVTGLTAGSNTFTAKYRVTGGTGTFQDRTLTVIDMGS